MDQYLVKRHHQDPGYGWFPEAVDGMGCESILAYSHGELFPIVHDDILRGVDLLQQQKTTCSFRIIGKLGCGSYSTVWLGRDLFVPIRIFSLSSVILTNSCDDALRNSDRYLALKVLEREESTVHNSEMRILRKLGKLQVAFFHTHPQSGFRYLCLGLKPLGSSLSNRDDARIPYPSSLMEITSFMKVLIGKVIELHRKGICHGGMYGTFFTLRRRITYRTYTVTKKFLYSDISSGNVAFGVHENAFTPEALRKTFSSARKSYILFDGPENPPPALPPNLPKYIIKANIPVLLTDIEDLSKVDLLDFGQGTSALFLTCNL